MKIYSRVGLLLALFSSVAFAATPPSIVNFKQNETVVLTLSRVDINRLIVKDDKITSLSCPAAFCTIPTKEGEATPIVDASGAMLVGINVNEPFTFYINTLKGKSFGVFVTPLAIPAKTTQFVSQDRDTEEAKAFETSAPYAEVLISLMRYAMLFDDTGEVPDGYTYTDITHNEKKPMPLEVIPKQLFSGDTFSLLRYEVKNNTQATTTLTNTQFYVRGLRALSFDKKTLAPGQSTTMYQIVSGEWLK